MIIFYILLPFILFRLYIKKFDNPYKTKFIFGKKGSGKSTLMVKGMIRDIRHGWNVYSDMPELSIKGVRFIQAKDLATFAPPPKSSIYLDEVGISMDNREFKTFPPGLRDFFKLARHFHCKITVNSQSYDVDKKVRDCVDSLILQSNLFNVIGISRPIVRSVTLTEASSQGESRIADQLKFASILSWKLTWLPRYHRYFSSFNIPKREQLPFKEFDGFDVSGKRQLRFLRRAFRK